MENLINWLIMSLHQYHTDDIIYYEQAWPSAMLAPHRSTGQRWLGGASHLLTFGWFQLHDIGCMESARWMTPAEGVTIVCAGLGV